jgi:hypothetical protein
MLGKTATNGNGIVLSIVIFQFYLLFKIFKLKEMMVCRLNEGDGESKEKTLTLTHPPTLMITYHFRKLIVL